MPRVIAAMMMALMSMTMFFFEEVCVTPNENSAVVHWQFATSTQVLHAQAGCFEKTAAV